MLCGVPIDSWYPSAEDVRYSCYVFTGQVEAGVALPGLQYSRPFGLGAGHFRGCQLQQLLQAKTNEL